jgi:hypothetical protein
LNITVSASSSAKVGMATCSVFALLLQAMLKSSSIVVKTNETWGVFLFIWQVLVKERRIFNSAVTYVK